MKKVFLLLFLFIFLAFPRGVFASSTTTFYPDKWRAIDRAGDNTAYPSSLGRWDDNQAWWNWLAHYDFSSIEEASISSATYYHKQTSWSNGGTAYIFRMKPANEDWTTSATWLTKDGTNAWAGSNGAQTSGTDYYSTQLGSFTNPSGQITVSLDVDEFQYVVDNDETIMSFTTANSNAWNTTTLTDDTYYQKIVVVYDEPTPTPTATPTPSPTPTPFTQPESTSSADWCTYKLVTEDYTDASWIFGFPIPDTYDSSDESSYFLLDFSTGIGWDTIRVQQNVQTPTDLYPESNGWSVTETDAYTYKIDYNLGMYPIIGTPEDYLKEDYDLTQSIGEHSWFGMGIFGTNHAQPTDVLITVEYIDGKTLACSNESVVEEDCDTLDIVCHINKWIINIKKWFEGLITRFYGWLYALFVPTQSTTDAIEDLTDIARTKSPWAYLYAVQDMDLTNPSYATSTAIPDFQMGSLSVKIRDGESIQLTPEVTLQSSTWGNLTELVEKVRDGIGVFIIIAWALGLAVLIVNNIL